MTAAELIKKRREELGLSLQQLGDRVGVTKMTISRWESGNTATIKQTMVAKLASALSISPIDLLFPEDYPHSKSRNISASAFDNISPITTQRLPMLGEIACGEPIFASEDRESYVEVGTNIKADFCLTCKGDSMTGARIYNGDIVFIRKQEIVDNGQIAAVIIDNAATLKRVFYYPEKGKLVLQAENPQYEPLVYVGDELNDVRILGKAVAFQSDVR